MCLDMAMSAEAVLVNSSIYKYKSDINVINVYEPITNGVSIIPFQN